MTDLSGLCGCSTANMTGIIQRLVSRGLVVRKESPKDRLVTFITTTNSGKEIFAELMKISPSCQASGRRPEKTMPLNEVNKFIP